MLQMNSPLGPFQRHTINRGQIGRFGVIPKHHKTDAWRLIIDMSFPEGKSVDDGISKSLCSLFTMLRLIMQSTKLLNYALGSKVDIKSTFWLLPEHPADRHLLQGWLYLCGYLLAFWWMISWLSVIQPLQNVKIILTLSSTHVPPWESLLLLKKYKDLQQLLLS